MNSSAVHAERAATERHRHQCEVRMLIAARTDERRGEELVCAYLAHPRVAGRKVALTYDMQDQMNKGHDGREGLWL